MRGLRLAFLNAAHDGASTARNFRRDVDADLVEFDANGGELPERTGDAFDGVIVTGSRSSVYWDEDWIPPLREYVASAVEEGVPTLGVCFGHQLVADALGGTVEDMGEYEIGYRTVSHAGDDPLFDGVDEEFTAFTTHSDAVTALPPGAVLIAENDYGIHGFRKGNAAGVQFHPEYDMATAERVTRQKEDLSRERIETVVDGITEENFQAACEAKRVFDNFCRRVRRVRGEDGERSTAAD